MTLSTLIVTAIVYANLVYVLKSMFFRLMEIALPEEEYIKYSRFNCSKCITFWVLLIVTCNPFIAGTAAIYSILIDKLFAQRTEL